MLDNLGDFSYNFKMYCLTIDNTNQKIKDMYH